MEHIRDLSYILCAFFIGTNTRFINISALGEVSFISSIRVYVFFFSLHRSIVIFLSSNIKEALLMLFFDWCIVGDPNI